MVDIGGSVSGSGRMRDHRHARNRFRPRNASRRPPRCGQRRRSARSASGRHDAARRWQFHRCGHRHHAGADRGGTAKQRHRRRRFPDARHGGRHGHHHRRPRNRAARCRRRLVHGCERRSLLLCRRVADRKKRGRAGQSAAGRTGACAIRQIALGRSVRPCDHSCRRRFRRHAALRGIFRQVRRSRLARRSRASPVFRDRFDRCRRFAFSHPQSRSGANLAASGCRRRGCVLRRGAGPRSGCENRRIDGGNGTHDAARSGAIRGHAARSGMRYLSRASHLRNGSAIVRRDDGVRDVEAAGGVRSVRSGHRRSRQLASVRRIAAARLCRS